MSFKSKFLEAENARLRAENRQLLACLLERAGHRTAAEMLRTPPQDELQHEVNAARLARNIENRKAAGLPEAPTVPDKPPTGRNWRAIRAWLEGNSRVEENQNNSDSEPVDQKIHRQIKNVRAALESKES